MSKMQNTKKRTQAKDLRKEEITLGAEAMKNVKGGAQSVHLFLKAGDSIVAKEPDSKVGGGNK